MKIIKLGKQNFKTNSQYLGTLLRDDESVVVFDIPAYEKAVMKLTIFNVATNNVNAEINAVF